MPRYRRKKKKIQPTPPAPEQSSPQTRGHWRGKQPKLQLPRESDLIERLGLKVIR